MRNRYKLADEVNRRLRELDEAKRNLDAADKECGHAWGPSENADIWHPGYTDPGDTPGTMGVDWRGPMHIPGRMEKRWKRVCIKCGKVEFTSHATTATKVVESPRW